MKKYSLWILTGIIVLAGLLRLYKLDKIPPSLNWDEVAAGYNAYTIAHWGKDEWGKIIPLVFTSFRDDKHPVHIYLTAPIVGLFGLTDFNTRFSSAVIGILGVGVIFFLAKYIFDSSVAGFFASLFLALSPYHLHYSRGLWEANFALFFFLLGLMLFCKAIKKKSFFLPYSFFCFGLSLLSYHSSKIVVFPLVLFLILLYIKKLLKIGKNFYLVLAILAGFVLLIVTNPRLLGLERANQTKFSDDLIKNTALYKKTNNYIFGYAEVVAKNWKDYYQFDYLFKNGDQNPRGSIKTVGQFLLIDAFLVPIGFFGLLLKKRKELLFLTAWSLLAPLPAAMSSTTPNATRSIFLLGSVILVSAYGASLLFNLFKAKWVKIAVCLLILSPVIYQSYRYLKYYFTEYAKKEAVEWQYGMKDVVAYIKNNPEYSYVYMDNIRQQPYIFFLYYLKTPLPDFLKTVKYDQSASKSFNTVAKYGKYQFGGWNPIESYPNYGILYVITPSYYTGLRHFDRFSLNKEIKYPGGGDAFYIVTAQE